MRQPKPQEIGLACVPDLAILESDQPFGEVQVQVPPSIHGTGDDIPCIIVSGGHDELGRELAPGTLDIVKPNGTITVDRNNPKQRIRLRKVGRVTCYGTASLSTSGVRWSSSLTP